MIPELDLHTSLHQPRDIRLEGSQSKEYHVRIRALSDNVKTFAEEFGGYLAGKVDAIGDNGQIFADTLIFETLSTICENFFSGAAMETFVPEIVGTCVAAMYTANALATP
jgi:hypothetical protein